MRYTVVPLFAASRSRAVPGRTKCVTSAMCTPTCIDSKVKCDTQHTKYCMRAFDLGRNLSQCHNNIPKNIIYCLCSFSISSDNCTCKLSGLHRRTILCIVIGATKKIYFIDWNFIHNQLDGNIFPVSLSEAQTGNDVSVPLRYTIIHTLLLYVPFRGTSCNF